MLALLTPVLLFIAFLLLLLVTLSVPIIKTIYLFSLSAQASSSLLHSSASVSFRGGVFGWCTSGADVSLVSIINENTPAECSKPHLGYSFDSTVATALHVDKFENLISKSLTAALALHPLVVALTFVTLLISLFMLRRGSNGTSRLPSLLALIMGVLTASLTTIVFIIDVALVALVRKHVHNDTDGVLTLNWGNAVWLTLTAAILLWIANVGSIAGCLGGNRRRTYV
ncbi:actin cortical patch SUR7/pH-response regulator pali [Mycena rosella]|uniref:Actin cortical patch SUR7/pH-response regulator pali n=1 Tax=Mycena rosella TaxID=1033263 RepID=A0AAD7MC41_MYCRO|nr:actin cortical patch SUR7/pH-response regulator pali [Mycena rosella]